MNPLFQLGTRNYEQEIHIIKQALTDLEKQCNVKHGYTIEPPFTKFGWTFFNIQINEEMANTIEKSGMMKGASGYRIGEQITNFMGHYLEEKGSNVRIKKIDY